jgi:hypothetical protein
MKLKKKINQEKYKKKQKKIKKIRIKCDKIN